MSTDGLQIQVFVYSSEGPEVSIPIYEVLVQDDKHGTDWRETAGSLGELNMLLRGMKAMAVMLGNHSVEVPTFSGHEEWQFKMRLREAPFKIFPRPVAP